MGDFDRVEFCPKCQSNQAFNLSGSGNKGRCMRCGTLYAKETIQARPGSKSDRFRPKTLWVEVR